MEDDKTKVEREEEIRHEVKKELPSTEKHKSESKSELKSEPVKDNNSSDSDKDFYDTSNKSNDSNKDSLTEKFRENPWVLSTLVLGVVTLILLVGGFGGITGGTITGGVVSEGEAGDAMINFANAQGAGAELVEVNDDGDFYEVILSINGQEMPVYVTKDGKYFTQALIPLDEAATPPIDRPTTTPPTGAPVDVSVDDDAVKGDLDAPVTIIEFSDYECPFCGRHYRDTLPQIISEYVDTGKVKLIFRDFPLGFHSKAQKAGEAAECAGEQGKYWEMHDKLFDNQDALSVDDLKAYAKELKLNTAKFDACLDNGDMEDEVKQDLADGQAAGVSGTPASFINGRFVSGAQPFSAFKKIIDEELAKVETV